MTLESELATCIKELKMLQSDEQPIKQIDQKLASLKQSYETLKYKTSDTETNMQIERKRSETLKTFITLMYARQNVEEQTIKAFESERDYYQANYDRLKLEYQRTSSETDKIHSEIEQLKKKLAGVDGVFAAYNSSRSKIFEALRRLTRQQLSQLYQRMKLIESRINDTELYVGDMTINVEISTILLPLKNDFQSSYSPRGNDFNGVAVFNQLWLICLTFTNHTQAAIQFKKDKDINEYLRNGNYIARTDLSIVMKDMKERNMFD